MKLEKKLFLFFFNISVILFTHCTKEEIPSVTTKDVTDISVSGAKSGGDIISDGDEAILVKGVCWSTESMPTTADQQTLDGIGFGPFTSQITDLNPGTTYYLRSYATNKNGTGYGTEISFRTTGDLPSATTKTALNISAFTAKLEGAVDPQNLSTTILFEYGTSTNYNLTVPANPNTVTGDDPVNVSAILSGLAPNTTYHFRIKAANVLGTGLGNDLTFKTPEIVTDIDGNSYEIVTVGNQVWMKENLKTTRYRDGSTIPLITQNADWQSRTSGAFSSYNNNNANTIAYGALYNWYAVIDSRGLCPAGWHIPTNDELTTLTNYLGGVEVAGGKMKKFDTTHWINPNTGASNSSQLSVIGSGFRDQTGIFSEINMVAYLWSSSEYSSTHGIGRKLYYNSESVSFSGNYKQSGFSVRCIKD